MLDWTEVENGKPFLVNVKLQTEFKSENDFLDIFCSLNSDHKLMIKRPIYNADFPVFPKSMQISAKKLTMHLKPFWKSILTFQVKSSTP